MGNIVQSEIAANQSNKATTANDALAEIDAGMTELLEIDLSTADATLTAAQYRGAFTVKTTGNDGTYHLALPAQKRACGVYNGGTGDLNVTVGATTVTIPAATGYHLYTDGTTDGLISLGGGGGESDFIGLTDTPTDYTNAAGRAVMVNSTGNALEFATVVEQVGGWFDGAPSASQTVFRVALTDATDLPADLAGSVFRAGTAPSGGDDVYDVQVAGASIGSVTFADGATSGTASVTATACAAGDVVALIAPTTLYGSADLTVTIKGTL
ncbi:hypothetical protein [Roseospirillum parvum]|uniref:Uncharacterized protein n=1 Tax=Roseospirillum parvum TaxID=83401 RepID=A0A1G8EVY6_9PROT|nr:hypothetical protein [Roseospirillum parvum]SDH74071.1 hypothetical protein SAMN05421742_11159 [Roseospirillum parvum]